MAAQQSGTREPEWCGGVRVINYTRRRGHGKCRRGRQLQATIHRAAKKKMRNALARLARIDDVLRAEGPGFKNGV